MPRTENHNLMKRSTKNPRDQRVTSINGMGGEGDGGGENFEESNRSAGSNCPTPFLFYDILEKIFSLLGDVDLDSCRTVCKLWHHAADKEKEKRHLVRINSNEDVKTTLAKLNNRNKRFLISSLYMQDVDLDSSHCKKLIEATLSNLSCLFILGCTITSTDSFYEFMRKVCPNLLKFDLSTVKTTFGKYIKFCPVPIRENEKKTAMVFYKMRHFEYISHHDWPEDSTSTRLSSVCKTFPNLSRLKINNMYEEKPERLVGMRMPHLKSLVIMMMPHVGIDGQPDHEPFGFDNCPCCTQERNRGLVPLGEREFLKTEGGLKDGHIKSLMNLNLKLEDLTLSNINRRTDPEIFKQFLQSFGSTLKQLTLKQDGDVTEKGRTKCRKPAPSPFPVELPSLKSLKVEKPFIRNLNHVLNSCPNVSEAIFDFCDGCDWSSIMPARLLPRPKITNLFLGGIDGKTLTKLIPMMSAVHTLSVNNLSDDVLNVIFTQMLHLRTLYLFDGEHFDGNKISSLGLVGLTTEEVQAIDDSTTTKKALPMAATAYKMRAGRSYIGNLKNLCILTLCAKNSEVMKSFVKYGIRDCFSLQMLTINGEEMASPEMQELMKERNYMFANPLDKSGNSSMPTFFRKDFYNFCKYNDDEEDKEVLSSSSWSDVVVDDSLRR